MSSWITTSQWLLPVSYLNKSKDLCRVVHSTPGQSLECPARPHSTILNLWPVHVRGTKGPLALANSSTPMQALRKVIKHLAHMHRWRRSRDRWGQLARAVHTHRPQAQSGLSITWIHGGLGQEMAGPEESWSITQRRALASIPLPHCSQRAGCVHWPVRCSFRWATMCSWPSRSYHKTRSAPECASMKTTNTGFLTPAACARSCSHHYPLKLSLILWESLPKQSLGPSLFPSLALPQNQLYSQALPHSSFTVGHNTAQALKSMPTGHPNLVPPSSHCSRNHPG